MVKASSCATGSSLSTARILAANSEVDLKTPATSTVAVAVMTSSCATKTGVSSALKKAFPVASVVTLMAPRNLSASPYPDEWPPPTALAKNSIRNVVLIVLSRLPTMTMVSTPLVFADHSSG